VILYLNHSLGNLSLRLVVILYLNKSLDYPSFNHSITDSLTLSLNSVCLHLALNLGLSSCVFLQRYITQYTPRLQRQRNYMFDEDFQVIPKDSQVTKQLQLQVTLRTSKSKLLDS